MIENKVAKSGLIQIDLEEFYPNEADFMELDLKPFLWQGIALKEKDFREALKGHNWEQYQNKIVAIFVSEEDVIIQKWAYMLIASYLEGVAKNYYLGNLEDAIANEAMNIIHRFDPTPYEDCMIVVKGCSDKSLPDQVYLLISQKLLPVVKSLMFGEPCSTVPIYKRKKK